MPRKSGRRSRRSRQKSRRKYNKQFYNDIIVNNIKLYTEREELFDRIKRLSIQNDKNVKNDKNDDNLIQNIQKLTFAE